MECNFLNSLGSNRLSACTRHVYLWFSIVAGTYSLNAYPPPLLASNKASRTSYRCYPGCGYSSSNGQTK